MRRALPLVALALATTSFGQIPKTEADMDKKELALIAKLEKAQVAARKAYFANPKNAKAKKTYVSATYNLAETVLVSPALGAKVKYPRALKLYREVVITDPTHKKSLERISLIESIYKSMHRPIPH